MTIDKDTVERLAKENHILKHEVHRGMTWYEVQHIDHLQAFAEAIEQKVIAEYVGSGEAVAYITEASMRDLQNGSVVLISNKPLSPLFAHNKIPLFTHPKQDDLQVKLDKAVEQMASLRKWVADGEYSDDSCYPKFATSEFRQAVTEFDNALSTINKE